MNGLRDRVRRGWDFGRRLVRGLLADSSEGSIAQRAVRGSFWLGASGGIGRLLQALQTVILTRLLIPADFGLMRLAVDGIAFAAVFSHFGVNTALVQRKELDEPYLQTAWTMDLFRYLLMFGAAMLLAGPLSRLVLSRAEGDAAHRAGQLAAVIRLVSLKFVFMGFSNNTGINMLYRELNFRRKQTYEICLSVVGVAFTVGLAFWLRSVWALAWGQVLYGFGEFVGSYIVHPFRPKFRFHWDEARELFSFGKHIFLSGMLGFLRGSLGTLLLGYLLGATAVGYYSLGRSLVLLPVGAILPAITGVLYPAFSRLQQDKAALRRGLLRVLGLGTLVVGPMLVGIAVTAGPLVRVAYGPDYLPAATVAILFCAIRYFSFVGGPMGSLLTARGKPGLNNIAIFADMVVLLSTVFPLIERFGLPGMVLAVLFGRAAEALVRLALVRRELELSLMRSAGAVARPLGASLLMGAGVLWTRHLVSVEGPAVLLILVPTGVVLYALFSLTLDRAGWREAVRMLKSSAASA